MKIGYIVKYDLELNPNLTERFAFREGTCTRTINSRGDKVRSKILRFAVDYEEIEENAKLLKETPGIMLVREPFLLDDELRDRAIRWVEWANKADPKEYDPFVE